MKTTNKVSNNKGFSLVELIIVIAIMAILAAAMAPQLMKYIEKSRVSTDNNNLESFKSAVTTALADEAVYADVIDTTTDKTWTVVVATKDTVTGGPTSLNTAVEEIAGKNLPLPKQTKKFKKMVVEIKVAKKTVDGVDTFDVTQITAKLANS